jgi:SAM-dependent methyltransferase
MSEPFSAGYADAYDRMYHDKDYTLECTFIEGVFKTYAAGSIQTILDLGCGTGNHACLLTERGYEVTGVDRSDSMLERATTKAAGPSGQHKPTFRKGDILTLDLHRHFDAVLMMFAVLGYQLKNVDVLAALKTARRHLRSEGLLIFDVWYGPAVLSQRPSTQVKVIPTLEGQILRVSSGELDTSRHLCIVHLRLWQLEGGRLTAETDERHCVRYFFPLELDFFLESAGFSPLRLGVFPEFDKEPDETTWNVLGVARAV